MTTTTPENIFRHRWNTEKDASLLGTVDALIRMSDRAIATLTMLSSQFEHEYDRLNDELLANVIYTAMAEVEDIRATVIAYHKSTRKAETA